MTPSDTESLRFSSTSKPSSISRSGSRNAARRSLTQTLHALAIFSCDIYPAADAQCCIVDRHTPYARRCIGSSMYSVRIGQCVSPRCLRVRTTGGRRLRTTFDRRLRRRTATRRDYLREVQASLAMKFGIWKVTLAALRPKDMRAFVHERARGLRPRTTSA